MNKLKLLKYFVFLSLISIALFIFYISAISPSLIPDSNIYFENKTYSLKKIDENTFRVKVSADILYIHKNSWLYSSEENPLPDDLPIRVRVLLDPCTDGCVGDEFVSTTVCSKNITVHYRKPEHFECSFNVSGRYGKYGVELEASWYYPWEHYDWFDLGYGGFYLILKGNNS